MAQQFSISRNHGVSATRAREQLSSDMALLSAEPLEALFVIISHAFAESPLSPAGEIYIHLISYDMGT